MRGEAARGKVQEPYGERYRKGLGSIAGDPIKESEERALRSSFFCIGSIDRSW